MASSALATGSRALVRSTTASVISLMGEVGLRSPVVKGRSRMAAQNRSDAARKTADQYGAKWRSIVMRLASVAIAAQMRPLFFPMRVVGGKVEAFLNLPRARFAGLMS